MALAMPMTLWTVAFSTLMWGILILHMYPMSVNHCDINHDDLTERHTHRHKLLVCNVQGAGNREFLNILHEHLRLHQPSIIGLVETHVSGRRAQEVCDKIGFTNCFRVEAQGFQGGIWVLWNSHEIDAVVIKSHHQFVTMEITPPNRRSWIFTVVYASPQTHM